MERPTKPEIAEALLSCFGRTYADELGIDVAKGTPSPLFRLLCAALLFSARIRAGTACRAARELSARGWTTAARLAHSSWLDRVEALDSAGYVRYDERTATMLGKTADTVLERYRGDLRRLREEAGRDPKRERSLLRELQGIGDVGVDIFAREAQVAWDELVPFADRRALAAGKRLGLGGDAGELAQLVGARDFARLVAALVRVDLEKGYDAVLAQAEECAGRRTRAASR